jgi:hypothetical protein
VNVLFQAAFQKKDFPLLNKWKVLIDPHFEEVRVEVIVRILHAILSLILGKGYHDG